MGKKSKGPGVCRVCECTDERACAGGCYWVDATHTLCSACEPCPDCGLAICECDEHEAPT